MSEDKICPFMSRPRHRDDNDISVIECKKEKCMAWGVVGDRASADGSGRRFNAFGCKLIERS